MTGDDSPEREPEGGPPQRKPPRGLSSQVESPARRYSLYVGLAFVALAIFAAVNSILSEEGGLLGSGSEEEGTPMAPFAVPDALSSLEGDANIFVDDCESSRNPCPPEDRRTPACEVAGDDVIRACDLFDKPLVLSFWFTRGGDCLPSQDAIDALAERYRGRVNFLSVNVRDDREEVRRIVEERGWRVPVGYDADGAVSNLYRVGVCPTVALGYPGGILAGAAVGEGEVSESELAPRIDELIAESRRRAAEDR